MYHGGLAQLGERLHGMQEVSGSIQLVSTNTLNTNGRDAVFFVFCFSETNTCGVLNIDGAKMRCDSTAQVTLKETLVVCRSSLLVSI